MTLDWKAVALWALATIPTAAGVGWSANRFWQTEVGDRLVAMEGTVKSLTTELHAAQTAANEANQRLNCIVLVASTPMPGPPYGAAATQVDGSPAGVTDWYPAPPHPPSTMPNAFMVGQKDGTGAATNIAQVVNYYRSVWVQAAIKPDGSCAQ